MKKNFSKILKPFTDQINKVQRSVLNGFDKYGYVKSFEKAESINSNNEPIPWYTYSATEYLDDLDFSEKRIFEFGCGNSTLWWAKKAKEVVGVDNNIEWVDKIRAENLPNVKIIYAPVGQDYAEAIIEDTQDFDVIIIDGAFRDLSVNTALKKLSKTGMIIFDNSDRIAEFQNYRYVVEQINKEDFIQVNFKGFGPLKIYTWATSIFFTRNANFNSSKLLPRQSIGGFRRKQSRLLALENIKEQTNLELK